MTRPQPIRNEMPDLQGVVKAIVDANEYMTIATADEDGTPWASPVWCTAADYREFLWVPPHAHATRATSRSAPRWRSSSSTLGNVAGTARRLRDFTSVGWVSG